MYSIHIGIKISIEKKLKIKNKYYYMNAYNILK